MTDGNFGVSARWLAQKSGALCNASRGERAVRSHRNVHVHVHVRGGSSFLLRSRTYRPRHFNEIDETSSRRRGRLRRTIVLVHVVLVALATHSWTQARAIEHDSRDKVPLRRFPRAFATYFARVILINRRAEQRAVVISRC